MYKSREQNPLTSPMTDIWEDTILLIDLVVHEDYMINVHRLKSFSARMIRLSWCAFRAAHSLLRNAPTYYLEGEFPSIHGKDQPDIKVKIDEICETASTIIEELHDSGNIDDLIDFCFMLWELSIIIRANGWYFATDGHGNIDRYLKYFDCPVKADNEYGESPLWLLSMKPRVAIYRIHELFRNLAWEAGEASLSNQHEDIDYNSTDFWGWHLFLSSGEIA
jgi:hypothetical protein